ncbi:MAG TPA: response regulator [Xanthobacteraceae bacterium]|nr:response regulator [Xanthobacteraceae bacterium]
MPASRTSFPLDLSAISFLVVDDQPFSRRLIHSMLLGFGSREIYESANGAEAFELARNALPNIIITDLIMPDLNGLLFIKLVKNPESPCRATPVIVLSGYLTKSAALTIRSSGADELLVKPVSPKALYEHIARIVLRNDSPTPPDAFVQNRKRRAAQERKQAGDVAYL